MVIADIKNVNTHGAIKKRMSKLACPKARTLPSAKTHINNPMINKKTMMTT
jgi:hypothetical protein